MRADKYIVLSVCLLLSLTAISQGDSYSNAIPVTMDAVVRNYASSSATGNNLICSPNGTTPVTWFSITTNADGNCPLLNITASDSLPCEIAMYTSIQGNMNNNLETNSSMCFYDGFGLWAPAETFVTDGGKTYYLRIKTSTACTISIAGQHHAPENDDCSGALSLGTVAIQDNNACHQPGPGVSPDQLCAYTLENTAFYQFYVATDGASIINITKISCDNGGINNSSGFQIGFFTGDCLSLNSLSCDSGTGDFVQATTPTLSAGTRVYVAIDGNGGSNCSYSIEGINVVGVLETGVRNFSAWQRNASNLLAWKTSRAFNGHRIIIERSADGVHFYPINELIPNNPQGLEKQYQFEDLNPLDRSFYRLVIVYGNNRKDYSIIKEVRRAGVGTQIILQNPAGSFLNAVIQTSQQGAARVQVLSMSGQVLQDGIVFCQPGNNVYQQDLSQFSVGKYIMRMELRGRVLSKSFLLIK